MTSPADQYAADRRTVKAGGAVKALADQYAADREAVNAGEATECGARCGCHEGLVCTRAAHPHTPDLSSPHLTAGDGGALVQWQCHEDHTDAQ